MRASLLSRLAAKRIKADPSLAEKARGGGNRLTPVWVPQPGPQSQAYLSLADEIGYGGAAGGGKSDLMLGKAGTQHRRSTIFRRVFPSLSGMIERSREIFNQGGASHLEDSFNESLHRWRLGEGRIINFRAVQYLADLKKHQGQPNDFLGFDEATEFPESFVRFLMAWNRTTDPDQRCCALFTFNPPMDDEGSWVVPFFAPWLDRMYPDKAADGEIRLVVRIDDKDTFYRDYADIPVEIQERLAQDADDQGLADWTRLIKRRTFFHASLKDNPALARTGYGATIEALPEPLRSFLKGNFNAARSENPWQIIPRAWVEAAQKRWTPEPAGPMSALGVDVARGGADETALAPRHGTWYGQIVSYPGKSTPDGPSVAGLIINRDVGAAQVNIDVIGVGSSVYDHTAPLVASCQPINVGSKSEATDRSGKLKFANIRTELWWLLREALDPVNGDNLALPPDPVLLAELCAPTFKPRGGGVIIVEEKDALRARLGRSTNRADALLLSRAADVGWLLA